jgi:hypothetical protein
MPISDLSVVQISVRGQSNGQAVVNVFHYIPGTINPVFGSSMTQVLSAFRSGWRAAALPRLIDDYQVTEYSGVEIMANEPDPNDPNKRRLKLGEEASLPGEGISDTGAIASDPLPTYVAATFRKKTNLAGRSRKGSARFGPLPESFTEPGNGNQLTAAAQTALLNVATFLKTSLSTTVPGDTLNPCVFSRTTMLPKVPVARNDTLAARTAIQDVTLNVFLGSQVSRKQRASAGA